VDAAADDWRAARASYERVVSGAASAPDLLVEGQVGLAEALSRTGDATRAASIARDALAPDTLPDPLAARAWMVVADDHRDSHRPREAFFAYLRVVTLYGEAPEAARACFEAARLVRGLAAEGGAARAKELAAELHRRFPGSEWDRPLGPS
jgi:hypothetical protein